MLVYHATEDVFDYFCWSHCGRRTGTPRCGFWFSDNRDACLYFGYIVLEVELAITNPKHVSDEEFAAHRQGPSWWARKAMEEDHDAVIIHDILDGDRYHTVTCVFDPELITILGRTDTSACEEASNSSTTPYFS